MRFNAHIALGIALLSAWLGATPAAAQTTPRLFGAGTRITHIGALSDETRADLGPNYGDEYALGFGYEAVTLFGLDLWTWNGRYCIYVDTNCDFIDAGRAAEVLGVARDALPRPWFYTLPPAMLLVVGALGSVLLRRRLRAAGEEALPTNDVRYQRALELVMAGTKGKPAMEQASLARSQFDDGVRYLTANSVSEDEGARNLLRMVDKLLEIRRRSA